MALVALLNKLMKRTMPNITRPDPDDEIRLMHEQAKALLDEAQTHIESTVKAREDAQIMFDQAQAIYAKAVKANEDARRIIGSMRLAQSQTANKIAA